MWPGSCKSQFGNPFVPVSFRSLLAQVVYFLSQIWVYLDIATEKFLKSNSSVLVIYYMRRDGVFITTKQVTKVNWCLIQGQSVWIFLSKVNKQTDFYVTEQISCVFKDLSSGQGTVADLSHTLFVQIQRICGRLEELNGNACWRAENSLENDIPWNQKDTPRTSRALWIVGSWGKIKHFPGRDPS